MIVEGLMTTRNADGGVNLAPMGPRVREEDVHGALDGLSRQVAWDRLRLRPFATSTTYRNLRRAGTGVFHVSDDVELIARAAIGQAGLPPLTEIPDFDTPRLADTCRWYALRVDAIDDRGDRVEIDARVVAWGRVRDFLGFNRGKHAVLEAAILATRIGLLPAGEMLEQVAALRPWVEKTGGIAERRAFDLLAEHIRRGASGRLEA